MAGNVWNPSAPSSVGEEWLADLFGTRDVGYPFAQRIRSRSAETIAQLKVMAPANGDVNQAVVLAEIIPAGSEIPTGVVTTATYQPNGDVTVGTDWTNQAGSGVNVFQAIDEGVATYSAADYAKGKIGGAGTTPNSDYLFRFASVGLSNTARILNVSIAAEIVASNANGALATMMLRDRVGGVDYTNSLGSMFASATPTQVLFDCGEINPKTNLPWTFTDIRGFDSAGALWAVNVRLQGANSALFELLACELRVTYQTVENRVAVASYVKPAGAVAAGPLVFSNLEALPGPAATWAKGNAADYTVLVRHAYDPFLSLFSPGTVSISWLSSLIAGTELASPVPGVVSAFPSMDTYGQVTAIDFTSSTRGRSLAMLLMTSAPAVSQDSLPYFLSNDVGGHYIDVRAGGITQQFTAPSTASYQILTLLLRPGIATANLLAKIKRVSDNVQFGTTATITPAQVAALTPDSDGFCKVTVSLPVAAALVNGTQYYIELSSADVSATGTGWVTIILGDATLAGGLATFEGTTSVVSVIGVAKNDYDMPFTLATVPAGPTSILATTQPLVLAGDDQACGIESMTVAHVTWTTGAALGALFARYEVQRTEDNGVTWNDVAWGLTEATKAWDDQEAPLETTVKYRVRIVRTDGAASAYSAVSGPILCHGSSGSILFVSNEQPALAVGYNREAEMPFMFVAPTRDVLHEIYGADYVVAFMESEDPGISVAFRLTVSGGQAPVAPGVDSFAPLRAISRAATSYVCVKDFTGDRYYAHLQFPKGDWSEPGSMYKANVVISEISGTPSIATF